MIETPINSESTASDVAKKSKSNFSLSFIFLPREKREAMYTVYAVCRALDDCVDEAPNPGEGRRRLDEVLSLIESAYSGENITSAMGAELAKVVQSFRIRKEWFLELARGMAMDLTQNRYPTFEELKTYCYRVASAVGMICIEIFGYTSGLACTYAESLGLALQLTNILRDVGDDAERGRIYLPLEDLDRFEYSESDVLSGVHNPRFVSLMAYQHQRAQDFFDRASAILPAVDRRTLFPAEMMRAVYHRLLTRIEGRQFRVFGKRIRVSKWSKLSTALSIYARDVLLNPHPIRTDQPTPP